MVRPMNGKLSYIVVGALALLAGGWIVVNSMGGKDGPGAGGDGGKVAPGRTGQGGGGETGGKRTKRERAGRPDGGGTVGTVPGAESYLSEAEARVEAIALVEGAMQLTDPAKRGVALKKIREGLEGSDEMAAYVALQAFVGIKELKMDRAAFRDLVEPWLEAEDPGMRRTAWYAFAETERHPEDVARVRGLAADPSEEVRKSASHLMFLYEKGDFTGESGTAVLGMLNGEEATMRREVMRGMWGARLSTELEAKVIELSRSSDPGELHDAVYFSLSTSANKSAAGVDRLIEVLADPDVVNNAGRAAWGLRQGVAEEDRTRVATAAVGLLENRQNSQLWSQAVELLGRYGTSEHRADVERMMGEPGLDARSRMSLEQVLRQMDGR